MTKFWLIEKDGIFLNFACKVQRKITPDCLSARNTRSWLARRTIFALNSLSSVQVSADDNKITSARATIGQR